MNSRERIRVAHVTLGLATGGQERLLVEFARRADAQRFALEVIVLGDRGPLAEEIEACGWPVLALGQPTGLRPRLAWRLARLLRKRQIDVVHTHDDRPLLYGAPAAWLAGRRCLHTQHHGRLPHITARQSRLVRWAARWTDPFICVSHDSARQMAAEGIAPQRIQVVHNGIDLQRFAARGPCLDGPAMTVARLSPEKDLGLLLHAVARVIRQEPSFRLEIAGDGPCREDLLRLSSELGLTGHVKFLGEVRQVAELLARARVFVLPSRTEGLSLTLLEAMASGLPVTATSVGGNPEVVDNGVTGTLTPAAQVEPLAKALVQYWRDDDLCLRQGAAGRERVERHFDVARMVQCYEALYERRTPNSPARALEVTTPCAS